MTVWLISTVEGRLFFNIKHLLLICSTKKKVYIILHNNKIVVIALKVFIVNACCNITLTFPINRMIKLWFQVIITELHVHLNVLYSHNIDDHTRDSKSKCFAMFKVAECLVLIILWYESFYERNEFRCFFFILKCV